MQISAIDDIRFEKVLKCHDPATGLHALIAIHSTKLGPALGGIRMRNYENESQALEDVLRLATAMTYKAAATELRLGGGKAVIIGDPDIDKTPELLRAMGEFINQLDGHYLSAKDAGITTADLITIHEKTEFVTGLPARMNGSDDPSPLTAKGVLEGIRYCVKYRYGTESLEGIKVLIQGAGHVGLYLGKLLAEEKALITISDIRDSAIRQAQSLFPAKIIHPDEVFRTPTQVLAPCAYGGVINDLTVHIAACDIIAGGANNQLADHVKHGAMLRDRNILYAPDYVINAGGIINIYVIDILKQSNPGEFLGIIGKNLESIFRYSQEKRIGTAEAADFLTEEKFEKA